MYDDDDAEFGPVDPWRLSDSTRLLRIEEALAEWADEDEADAELDFAKAEAMVAGIY